MLEGLEISNVTMSLEIQENVGAIRCRILILLIVLKCPTLQTSLPIAFLKVRDRNNK